MHFLVSQVVASLSEVRKAPRCGDDGGDEGEAEEGERVLAEGESEGGTAMGRGSSVSRSELKRGAEVARQDAEHRSLAQRFA